MKAGLAESARDDADLELLREFIAESVDNLSGAGTALVNLEKRPDDRGSVDAAFRTFHSIKGTCGFFDLNGIQVVSHRMETLLSAVKKGERHPDTRVTSTLLRGVDVLTTLLGSAVNGAVRGELSDEGRAYLAELDAVLANDGVAPNAAAQPVPEEPAAAVKPDVAVASPQKTMRIDEATIDAFLAYTGELISSSETFGYLQGKLDRESLSPTVKEEVRSAVRAFQALSLDLQKSIMEIRKLPLETSFAKYPRLVRDLSRTLGKQVSLEVVGSSLRIDKSIVELIDDPLVHLVRNSMDHGLESPEARTAVGKPAEGRLCLAAELDESWLRLTIVDDGRGIDPERVKVAAIAKGFLAPERAEALTPAELVNLIFAPGFSMAANVSNVSGRGVGMDVVLTNITRANGTVEVSSVLSVGTTIAIAIPLTVTTSIVQVLIVRADTEQLIVSLSAVRAVEAVPEGEFVSMGGGKHEGFPHRDKVLRLVRLTEALGWGDPRARAPRHEMAVIAILAVGGEEVAFLLDELVGIQRVALREKGTDLPSSPLLKGSAILRDGKVGLLLDLEALVDGYA